MSLVVQGYNVGQDVGFVIQDQAGDMVQGSDLGLLMMFEAKATDVKLKVTPISGGGVPIFQDIPGGWQGSIRFTRTNGSLMQFRSDRENAFFNNGVIQQFTIQAGVQNRDGTVDEYLWSGVQFEDDGFGNFITDKEVEQMLSFKASRFQTTGATLPILTALVALA